MHQPFGPFAAALSRGLGIPLQSITPDVAGDYFGWMTMFAALDLSAASAKTQDCLGWRPEGSGLIEDLDAMAWTALAA